MEIPVKEKNRIIVIVSMLKYLLNTLDEITITGLRKACIYCNNTLLLPKVPIINIFKVIITSTMEDEDEPELFEELILVPPFLWDTLLNEDSSKIFQTLTELLQSGTQEELIELYVQFKYNLFEGKYDRYLTTANLDYLEPEDCLFHPALRAEIHLSIAEHLSEEVTETFNGKSYDEIFKMIEHEKLKEIQKDILKYTHILKGVDIALERASKI